MPDKSQTQGSPSKRILGAHSVPRSSPSAWVMITIDTDAITAAYPNPSQNQKKPTRIARNMAFMAAPEIKAESRHGTADFSLNAQVGDTVFVCATSGSDNFEDAVLLYAIERFSGARVFSNFIYQDFQKSTVAPNSTTQPLPAQIVTETFWFYQAYIVEAGTASYRMQFALYTRDSNGAPTLFGYFVWDPSITVSGGS
jgi:hypothetical protein